jgi:hypothetical protein
MPKDSNLANKGAKNPLPDLTDTLIIVCLSAAIIILIFWLVTQTLHLDTFMTVPGFIRNSFQAIWTASASGTAGIGLAIYRALKPKANQVHPCYLCWIGITTAVFLAYIFAAYFILRPKVTPATPDADAVEDLKVEVIALRGDYQGLTGLGDAAAVGVLEKAPQFARKLLTIADKNLTDGEKIEKYACAGVAYVIAAQVEVEVYRESGKGFTIEAIGPLEMALTLISATRRAANDGDAHARSIVGWVEDSKYEDLARYYKAIALATRAQGGENLTWTTVAEVLESVSPGYRAANPVLENEELRWACEHLTGARTSHLCRGVGRS